MKRAVVLALLVGCNSLKNAATTTDAGTPLSDGGTLPSTVTDGGVIVGPDGGVCTTCGQSVTTGRTNVTFLAVDENHVYFNDGHSVVVCDREACATPLTLGTNATVSGLVVVEDTVYWTDSAAGALMSCPITGCLQPYVTLRDQTGIHALTNDEKNLYWVTNGTIQRCPIGDCGVDTVRDEGVTGVETRALAVSLDSLLWATSDQIVNLSLDNTATGTTVLSPIGGTDFSVDPQSNNNYWVDANRLIRGCRLGGCGNTPDQVATSLSPSTPVGFATQLYWRDLSQNMILTCERESCSEPTAFVDHQTFAATGQLVIPDEDWVYWTVPTGVMRAHR